MERLDRILADVMGSNIVVKDATSHYREPFNLLYPMLCAFFFLAYFISVFDYTDFPCVEVKNEEYLLLEKTVRGKGDVKKGSSAIT